MNRSSWRRLRHVLVGVSAASLVGVLAACGGGGDGSTGESSSESGSGGSTTSGADGAEAYDGEAVTIRFSWWGGDDRAARYEEALAIFAEEFPNITVQTEWASFADYNTARATEAAGSALPDVMQFDSAYLREYASSGRLLDLAPYVESGQIDLSRYEQSTIEAGQLDGVQAAIPTSTNTLSMLANPAVETATGVTFPEDGYTLAEYKEFVAEASAAGTTNTAGQPTYGATDFTLSFWAFLYWQLQLGNEPFTDDGQLGFSEEDIVEWLDGGNELRAAGAFYPLSRATAVTPKSGISMNEALAEVRFDSELANFVADSGGEEISIHPMFTVDGTTQVNFFRPSMHLAAGSNSQEPAAAAVLINFLLTDPRVGEIFGTSRGVPADSEQRAAIVAEDGSVDARVLEHEEKIAGTELVSAPIPVKGFGTLDAAWLSLGEQLSYGNITTEQFAQDWWAEAEIAIN